MRCERVNPAGSVDSDGWGKKHAPGQIRKKWTKSAEQRRRVTDLRDFGRREKEGSVH